MTQQQQQHETKALLMGQGSSQFNLALVRSRAEELRRSVAEVLEALSSGTTLRWEDFLKKFSVINQQMMGLREQLRGLLKQVVVHPKLVDNPGVAHALPIQLASKLTPEMEARDAELAAGVETPAAAAAGPATAASVRFSEISAQLDDFNRFVSGITGSGGLLAYRGATHKEVERGSKAIGALLAEAKAVAVAASGQLHVPASGGLAGSAALGRTAEAAPRMVGQQASKRARTGAGQSTAAAAAAGSEAAMDPALLVLFGDGLRHRAQA